jgi:hypothetical protein
VGQQRMKTILFRFPKRCQLVHVKGIRPDDEYVFFHIASLPNALQTQLLAADPLPQQIHPAPIHPDRGKRCMWFIDELFFFYLHFFIDGEI